MLKKYMLVVLVLVMALSVNMISFANDEETTEEDYVHIISPEVGESGKTILNDALFISIYVQSDDTLLLSMIKKETSIFTFEEKVEEPEFFEMIPLVAAEAIEEAVEEKVSLAEVTIVELTKEEIFSAYQIAEADLTILQADYEAAKSEIAKIPSLLDESASLYDPLYKLSEDEIEDLTYFEEISIFYNEALSEYIKWEKKYNKLFETVVFDQQEMIVDPSFPYFEHTVQDVTPGTYDLIISNTEGEVIETLTFEIVTEDIIADSIKEEVNIFDKIIDSNVFE
ncbi:MAG: hypothetical protein JEZ08_12330 [Clostridiales bacterium]|nr:hypothetical protein [Clostridiales bacterium]